MATENMKIDVDINVSKRIEELMISINMLRPHLSGRSAKHHFRNIEKIIAGSITVDGHVVDLLTLECKCAKCYYADWNREGCKASLSGEGDCLAASNYRPPRCVSVIRPAMVFRKKIKVGDKGFCPHFSLKGVARAQRRIEAKKEQKETHND